MKILRIIYAAFFMILSGFIIYYSIDFVWAYAMGGGWSGRDITTAEFLWQVKAPILLSIFSLLSCIGLCFNKRWGSLLGLALCVCGLFYYSESIIMGIGSGVISTTSDLTGYVFSLGVVFLATVGILRIVNAYGKVTFGQYALMSLVTSGVLISYYVTVQTDPYQITAIGNDLIQYLFG